MKDNYITTNVLSACLSKPNGRKKDIHTQLKETMAEHRKIMREFEKLSKEKHDLFANIAKKAA